MFENHSQVKRINNLIILKGVIRGILILLFISILMAVFSGFVFNLKANSLNLLLIFETLLILLYVGFYVARNVEKNGWLNGGLAGLVLMIIVVLLGTINMTISFGGIIILAVLGLIVGSVGGILGINL